MINASIYQKRVNFFFEISSTSNKNHKTKYNYLKIYQNNIYLFLSPTTQNNLKKQKNIKIKK